MAEPRKQFRDGEESDAYLEDLCFGAQQAAEAIKAVMISRNIDFPYVTTWPFCCRYSKKMERMSRMKFAARRLTLYAVDRYPSVEQPVTAYRDAEIGSCNPMGDVFPSLGERQAQDG